jgi:hypothetical protein
MHSEETRKWSKGHVRDFKINLRRKQSGHSERIRYRVINLFECL